MLGVAAPVSAEVSAKRAGERSSSGEGGGRHLEPIGAAGLATDSPTLGGVKVIGGRGVAAKVRLKGATCQSDVTVIQGT